MSADQRPAPPTAAPARAAKPDTASATDASSPTSSLDEEPFEAPQSATSEGGLSQDGAKQGLGLGGGRTASGLGGALWASNALWGIALICAFAGAHALMLWQALGPGVGGSTDVLLYAWWVQQGEQTGGWVGVEADWVYPVGALVPLLGAAARGTGLAYLPTWCLMVTLINLAASAVTVWAFSARRAAPALIGWFVFLAALGPVGLTRLDAVMMPFVLVALALAGTNLPAASVAATLSAWVKVAGGAVIVPLFALARTWRDRLVGVAAPAAAACLGVAGLQRLFGGDWDTLTSFVRAETDRGLQVEAVLATPAVLAHAWRGDGFARYNEDLGTSETWGPWAEAALDVSDWAMPAVAVAVGLLCWRARAHAVESLLVGSLAMMAGLIVAHKVGSPQFVAWLAPPVVVGLCVSFGSVFWQVNGLMLLAAAGLTGWLYPWGYIAFLSASPVMLTVWVVRNAIVVGVLVAALVRLTRLGRPARPARPEEGQEPAALDELSAGPEAADRPAEPGQSEAQGDPDNSDAVAAPGPSVGAEPPGQLESAPGRVPADAP
jgi:hypothetical protein